MRVLPSLVLILGLAACGDPGGASVEPPPSIEESPAASGEPTASEDPSASPSIAAKATITGTLSGDDIEGGCVFLSGDGGRSYEVIWPEGWSVTPELELTDPSGEVVATAGDELTVHGRIASDMASICQIGQIFEAVEVELPE
jgi:hypothetical protein